MPPAVSLCMIVKNEAPRLRACLASARGAVGEIVVVDTGSADGTPSMAAEWGAKVSTFDFRRPDFAAARNQSLAQASGAWILVLDADETLAEGGATVLAALAAAGGNVGYVAERRNVGSAPGAAPTDHVLRLFPNRPEHRYRGRVHETVDASILASGGRIRTSHLAIEHALPLGERVADKSRFYLSILEEELRASPDDVDRLTFRCAELHKLGRMDEAAQTAERIAILAEGDPRSHLNVGLYRLVHGRDVHGAERAFRKVLALEPAHAEALACLRALPANL